MREESATSAPVSVNERQTRRRCVLAIQLFITHSSSSAIHKPGRLVLRVDHANLRRVWDAGTFGDREYWESMIWEQKRCAAQKKDKKTLDAVKRNSPKLLSDKLKANTADIKIKLICFTCIVIN